MFSTISYFSFSPNDKKFNYKNIGSQSINLLFTNNICTFTCRFSSVAKSIHFLEYSTTLNTSWNSKHTLPPFPFYKFSAVYCILYRTLIHQYGRVLFYRRVIYSDLLNVSHHFQWGSPSFPLIINDSCIILSMTINY